MCEEIIKIMGTFKMGPSTHKIPKVLYQINGQGYLPMSIEDYEALGRPQEVEFQMTKSEYEEQLVPFACSTGSFS